MNETTQNSTQLTSLARALHTFQRTCEHAIIEGRWDGQANNIIGQYGRLHAKVRQTLPDDAYVASLALDADPHDPTTPNQLSFALSQLAYYVNGIQEAQ